MNLKDITDNVAYKSAKVSDDGMKAYVSEVVSLIERTGGKIEDYSVVSYSDPMTMETTDGSVTVRGHWKIVPTSFLKPVPTFEED